MSSFFGNTTFVVIFFGVAIFILSYINSDRLINFLYKRTLGQREELFKLLDKMYVEGDRRKLSITIVLLTFGLGIAAFLAFMPTSITLATLIGTAVALAGWAAPKAVLQNLWEGRCNRIVNQMVDGMTIMANGIKSGLSITQSMERVIENISGPLAQEFTLVLNQIRLGRSVEEALTDFGERIPRPDVQMFVTGVNILKETGGNLAETFATITDTIRERQKVEKRIDAMTSQGIMQAIIVTCVPFLLLVIFVVVNPTFVKPLFTTPLGWLALFFMLGLQVTGGVMMKKIVTIKV